MEVRGERCGRFLTKTVPKYRAIYVLHVPEWYPEWAWSALGVNSALVYLRIDDPPIRPIFSPWRDLHCRAACTLEYRTAAVEGTLSRSSSVVSFQTNQLWQWLWELEIYYL